MRWCAATRRGPSEASVSDPRRVRRGSVRDSRKAAWGRGRRTSTRSPHSGDQERLSQAKTSVQSPAAKPDTKAGTLAGYVSCQPINHCLSFCLWRSVMLIDCLSQQPNHCFIIKSGFHPPFDIRFFVQVLWRRQFRKKCFTFVSLRSENDPRSMSKKVTLGPVGVCEKVT